MQKKPYDTNEIAVLKQGIIDKLTWEQIAAQLPGRRPKGLKRHAYKLGLVQKARGKLSARYAAAKARLADEEPVINVSDDQRFKQALRKAIAAGRECVEEGVVTAYCTVSPRLIRAVTHVSSASPAALAADMGEKGGAFVSA